MNILFLLFFIPLFCSGLLLLFQRLPSKNLKQITLLLSLIPLLLLLVNHQHLFGQEINYSWISTIGIRFHFRIDSLSLIFLYLTAIIIPISIASQKSDKLPQPLAFYSLILFLEALLIGFFTTRDLAIFTLFFEAMLLPLYFIINFWGKENRKAASIKFLIYMIAGSSLMIAAVFALYFGAYHSLKEGSFNLDILSTISSKIPYNFLVATIFFLAFAVKTPLFPFHAWLPDAYTQAPTSGSILLSAILSKAGIYGFLRIGLELFKPALEIWSPYLIGLAIVGVFYGAFAAWSEKDYKRLIAYSSFSHVNFILVGIFILMQTGQSGAILQSFNHGITIAALFLTAGWLEERIGSTSLFHSSGLAKKYPKLCWLTFFFILASVALPGLNNFIGEFLILFGVFEKSPWVSSFLSLSIIFSVVYMLRWMQKIYFESPSKEPLLKSDIYFREFCIALPLLFLILWIGLYPAPILNEALSAVVKLTSMNPELFKETL